MDRFNGNDTDELLVQTIVEIAQTVRIETHLVQDGRM